jgi:hypothetical protein
LAVLALKSKEVIFYSRKNSEMVFKMKLAALASAM